MNAKMLDEGLYRKYHLDKNDHVINPGVFCGKHIADVYFYALYLQTGEEIRRIDASEQSEFGIDKRFAVVFEGVNGLDHVEYYDTFSEAELAYWGRPEQVC